MMRKLLFLAVLSISWHLWAARAEADVLFVSSFGDNGSVFRLDEDGKSTTFATGLFGATGLAFDSSGNLYVALGGAAGPNSIRKYSPTGANLGNFAVTGLFDPFALAFDSAGNLYVANSDGSSINKFSPSGTDLGAFADDNNGLRNPTGLAFDANGNLYAANTNTFFPSVSKFSPTGSELGFFGGDVLENPSGLAFDANGILYVSDTLRDAVRKFDANGNDLGDFAVTGLDSPRGLAFDSAGNLYVANAEGGTIRKFSPTGQDLGDFANGLGFVMFLAFQTASPEPVPEPGSLALLGLGLVGLFAYRARRWSIRSCSGRAISTGEPLPGAGANRGGDVQVGPGSGERLGSFQGPTIR